MELVLRALHRVLKGRFRPELITIKTDLVGDQILDSLDAMRFIFELERESGVRFPTVDLFEQGYYRIGKLITHISPTAVRHRSSDAA